MAGIRKRTVVQSRGSSCGWISKVEPSLRFMCQAVVLAVSVVCYFAVTRDVKQCVEAGSALLRTLKRAPSTNKQDRQMLRPAEPAASPIALLGTPVLPVALALCLIRCLIRLD